MFKKRQRGRRLSNKSLIEPKVKVMRSRVDGWGVYATDYIVKGEIVEECHVLLFDESPSELHNYMFNWSSNQEALPLGYGSIYNHADKPNCEYTPDVKRQLMVFRALRVIKPGEEIYTSYGQYWFEKRQVNKKPPFSLRNFLFDDLPLLPTLGYSAMLLVVLGFLLLY